MKNVYPLKIMSPEYNDAMLSIHSGIKYLQCNKNSINKNIQILNLERYKLVIKNIFENGVQPWMPSYTISSSCDLHDSGIKANNLAFVQSKE